jgi:limonene-1,2-epoxide hydrolase
MFTECSPNVPQAEEEIEAVKRFMTALSNVQKRARHADMHTVTLLGIKECFGWAYGKSIMRKVNSATRTVLCTYPDLNSRT